MKRNRILLVEDSPNDLDLLLNELRKIPVEVTSVATGQEGKDLLEKQPNVFSAVLLNLKLPDMHGISLIHFIKGKSPETLICIVTGHDDEATRDQVFLAGAVALFAKPYSARDNAALLNLLATRAASYDKGRKASMTDLVKTVIGNKHTSGAALFAFGLGVASILFPEHKEKLDDVFKLAVVYGFAMGSDAARKKKSEEQAK